MKPQVAYEIAERLYGQDDFDATILVKLVPGSDVELSVQPAKSADQRSLLQMVCNLAAQFGLEVRLSSPADHAHAPTLRLGRWGARA